MKRNYLTACSTLFIFLLLFASCKKEDFPKNTCRLERWQGLDDGYLRTHHYNEQGLTDQWRETHPWYGTDQLTTYEYDSHKRISRVKYYDHNVLQSTIIPEYRGSRIIKEFWYVADTQTSQDTVLNTYNAKGQIVKRESLSYDYYYVLEYDAIGNQLKGEIIGTDGTLLQSEISSYDKHVLNPDIAITGLPYAIQYINYTFSKLKFNYYKVAGLDADGNFITFYELDPDKSTPLKAGPGGYAVYFNTFEIESQLYNRQIWRYQNCDCDKNDDFQKFTPPAFNKSFVPGKNQRRRLLTMQEMREKITEMRKRKTSKR